MSEYLHGYNDVEFERLLHQATFLAPFIFEKLDFSHACFVLEPGCGVGAQTKLLAEKNPNTQLVAFDREATAIQKATEWLQNWADLQHQIQFLHADAGQLKSKFENYFDTCYICWMLEHVTHPVDFLMGIKPLLKKNCQVYVTEVQNETLQLFPNCHKTLRFWEAICAHQISIGGDPYVGLKCAEYLEKAGFSNIIQVPYNMRLDSSNREKLREMIEYWTNLMRSVSPYLPENLWEGVEDELIALAKQPDAYFSYTFIQTFASL